jgi:hypothetical protein
VHAFEHRQARGLTFELYNGPGSPIGDWGAAFDALTPDFAASR